MCEVFCAAGILRHQVPAPLTKKSIIFMMFLDLEEIELRNFIDFPGPAVFYPELT